MAIQTTYTAFNANAYVSRATPEHDGWSPRLELPEADIRPAMRGLSSLATPVVQSLAELVQPVLLHPQDTTSMTTTIDTDDDELRGVFAEMAMDRQNRVAARAQVALTVAQDWTRTQEEVRTNEQMRQANMSNLWRSAFNPYGGGGMMPMPMTPMAPQPLGMQVSMPGQPGMMQPGMPMTGTFNAFPGAPGAMPGTVPGAMPGQPVYPAPPGVSSAMTGAPPYYFQ